MLEKAKMWLEEAEKRQKQQVGHRKGNNEVSQCVSLADPDLDAAPPRAPQLIQQPQALANPPPYPQPGTSLTPKPSPYDELRRQLEAITSPVAHRTRSHTTIKPSAEPEVGYAPQFPMVEVSGPEGVIMVHRHWTADDIMKVADGLSKPGDIGGRRFGQELMAFVQSCRPTQAELRRLLMIRLGPQYNRIDRNWVDGDVRLHLPEWNAPPQGQPDLNGPYREMIRGLIERVETAYPTTINTDVIASCKQKDDEPVADFLVRLMRVHTDHCGIDTPAQRAAGPGEVGAWEAHLRNSFLMNMRKDISDLIRKKLHRLQQSSPIYY
ncbi:hypothetical protein P4O66_000155 [Electrophorus voltai]|uniref:Core shell protein Gag P30 domain-containing protein n=1 Tax=Electrophorus voltai TaxID=2609070 RepID=A0AAD8ZVR3_9TELE|nr:hypothetical protein P4O66_000155 [Electrophorus voltai]